MFLGGLAMTVGGCATSPVPAARQAQPAPARSNLLEIPSVDAHWANYGGYLKRMVDTVQSQWDRVLTESKVRPATGTSVTVKFVMGDGGQILKIVSVEGTASDAASQAGVSAITDRAPYGPWSDAMKADLGKEQEMTFRFVYQ